MMSVGEPVSNDDELTVVVLLPVMLLLRLVTMDVGTEPVLEEVD